MKIINNRVVCSGCEEPFEVGQKYRALHKIPTLATQLVVIAGVQGIPAVSWDQHALDDQEVFHEGCD